LHTIKSHSFEGNTHRIENIVYQQGTKQSVNTNKKWTNHKIKDSEKIAIFVAHKLLSFIAHSLTWPNKEAYTRNCGHKLHARVNWLWEYMEILGTENAARWNWCGWNKNNPSVNQSDDNNVIIMQHTLLVSYQNFVISHSLC